MNELFGIRFSRAMELSGKSAREIADETGIAYNTVLCYARGERNPTMHNIVAVCRCLGVRSDWLLGLV